MSDRPTGPRCAALVGPYLSGKTTLLEALLFASGTINRHGTQKDGNTVGDATPEARGRQMSTEINVARAAYLDDPWTFLDCPGSVELAWEAQNAMLASDVAVVVCEPEVERALTLGPLFKFLDDHQIPHMVFINKMDTASARVSEVLAALQGVSQRPLVLRQVPMEGDEHPNGYVDLVSERAYKYKPGAASDLIKLPDELADEEKTGRAGLVEKLADFDDKLLEQLLEDVQPSKEDIYRHLTQNLRRDLIVPVFLGAALQDHGVRRLLKALRHETPDVATTAMRLKLDPKSSETVANVIKTYHPPNAGKLSLARVWSGQVTEGMSLNGVRVAGVLRLLGAQSTKASSAGPGEVVALARLEGIATGTVLSSGASPPAFPTLPIPHSVYGLAIAAQNRNDDVKLSGALHRLIEEDPTLSMEHNAELQEQVLCGQGDIHLQVALDRLKHRFNLGTLSRRPQVPYKESIKLPGAIHSRFKRQSGGARAIRRHPDRDQAAAARHRSCLQGCGGRRRDSAQLHPRGRGRRRRLSEARPARLSRCRCRGDADHRPIPRRRQLGPGVQDGGAPGDDRSDAEMQSGAARADLPRLDLGAECVHLAGAAHRFRPARANPGLRRQARLGRLGSGRSQHADVRAARPHRRAALGDPRRRHLRGEVRSPARADRQARRESVAMRAGEAAQ